MYFAMYRFAQSWKYSMWFCGIAAEERLEPGLEKLTGSAYQEEDT